MWAFFSRFLFPRNNAEIINTFHQLCAWHPTSVWADYLDNIPINMHTIPPHPSPFRQHWSLAWNYHSMTYYWNAHCTDVRSAGTKCFPNIRHANSFRLIIHHRDSQTQITAIQSPIDATHQPQHILVALCARPRTRPACAPTLSPCVCVSVRISHLST